MSEQAIVTCRITVVEPGMPDRVIKVRPAQHDHEKIWLDTRPGIERWEAVKTLMKRFCPRGRYVPDAAYWHQPGAKPEDVNTPILKEEDIPLVDLDGAVLEAPPARERVSRPKPADLQSERVVKLEQKVDKLTDALAGLVTAMAQKEQPQPRKAGRPKKIKEAT